MAKWSAPSKWGVGALGVYISSRILHRFAKIGLLGAALAGLLYHRELLLFAAGSDAFTATLLGALYETAPPAPARPSERVRLSLAADQPARNLPEPLLGFAIDTSQVVGGHWWSQEAVVEVGRGAKRTAPFDFRRPRLRALARALAPARLRIGGTEADHVFYAEADGTRGAPPEGYELVFSRNDWNRVAEFAQDVGYSLMFTINAGPGPRDANGAWQPDNARLLLGFAKERAIGPVVWELGNEVNAYWFIHGLSARVSGAQYARDFERFRRLVHGEFPAARLAGPAGFLWPVMGEPFSGTLGIFEDYLKHAGPAADIVTWHYYPQQSRRCPLATRRASPSALLNPAVLDETERWAEHLEGLVARHAPSAELWLGESGNAQCGGEPGVSDRFASSLWYLDQLAVMALRGQPMIRQTLVGSHYGLLDPDSLEPWPDYWAAFLFRKLVGKHMLRVDRQGNNPYLRVYAACSARAAGHAPGSVTYLLINLHAHEPAHLQLDTPGNRTWYRVTAPSLDSREVRLNGALLSLEGDTLPELSGSASAEAAAATWVMPRSYAFSVVEAGAEACP